MTIYLKDACYVDWKSLEFTRGHFAVTSGDSGKLTFLDNLPAEETLSDAIQRIERLDYRRREDKAESAYNAARSFNTQTISQWLEVFRRIVT